VIDAKKINKIPNFSVPSTSGEDFSLSDYKGKYVVLYFYPKDSTPGCTLEGQEFTKLIKKFRSLGALVFGVSRDSLKSHNNFKTKQCYEFDLLSDQDEKLCQIFDVIKEKNMYGKKVIGIERSTFLISPEGKLIQEWRKVKVTGHAAEVLEALKVVVAAKRA
jgi:peroxiredoxin Q/BCP